MTVSCSLALTVDQKLNNGTNSSTPISETTTTSSYTAGPSELAEKQETLITSDQEVYRPSFVNVGEEFGIGSSVFDELELHKSGVFPESSEFDWMKVERQISASLYAMNGVHEYLEAVTDSSDQMWDLPPLCQLFYRS
ncbi:hypothetical protein J5N97_027418 [Dioscorea zingiberensis]|uniref:Uncharacterized protein n=1 Tax=Dioscorea zingiberensis TaxID=325984 RepID=A0A9D5C4U2_9LILI|nr:hypothetical protein J5N97_027418 [Dioscorea zingiberensis]